LATVTETCEEKDKLIRIKKGGIEYGVFCYCECEPSENEIDTEPICEPICTFYDEFPNGERIWYDDYNV